MITYGPRAIMKDGQPIGRWDFVEQADVGPPSPAGYCAVHRRAGNYGGHHSTKEDAVKCFVTFVRDTARLDGTFFVVMDCAVCGGKTFKAAVAEKRPIAALCSEYCFNKWKDALTEAFVRQGRFEVFEEAFDDPD